MRTPCYVFDADQLLQRLTMIRDALPGIPVTYSIKANSFVTGIMGKAADHLEVCSPGEMQICRRLGISGERIIYSGVMKEIEDVEEAIAYGAGILTAESPEHFRLIRKAAESHRTGVRVLLRLSSGNQFGMDQETLLSLLKDQDPWVSVYGIHYYSGTQKKKVSQISHDLDLLRTALQKAKDAYGFEPGLVEYGPGLATEYFKQDMNAIDQSLLEEAAPLLREFAQEAPLGVEFGRFLAATCGTYYSAVKDLKTTDGIRYAILDGGIHHVKYYGQIMSMHTPPVHPMEKRMGEPLAYCLCGSLCTVSDVLVHEIQLPELQTGDVLAFEKCGAYSVTEASSLFLSRDLPAVYLQQNGEPALVRRAVSTWEINCPDLSVSERERDAASCRKD